MENQTFISGTPIALTILIEFASSRGPEKHEVLGREVSEMKRVAILSAFVALVGCGGDQSLTPIAQVVGSASPRISVVAPQAVAVGDAVEVVGANFVNPQYGKALIQFKGQFIDDQGQEYPFERMVEGTYHDSNRLSWKVWPDVVFHPDGNRLGYFLGEVTVINNGLDGSRRASSAYRVKLDIEPSLLLRSLRPTGASCPTVVTATHEDMPLSVAVEALGFAAASESSPLEFTWSFGLENLDVKPDDYGIWDFQTAEATEGLVTVTETVTSGTMSGLQDASGCQTAYSPDIGRSGLSAFLDGLCRENTKGQKQFVFKFLDDVRAVPGFKVLRTRKIAADDQRGQVQAPITIAVRDRRGQTAYLSVPLDIYKPVSMIRDAVRDRIIHRDQIVRLQDEVAPGNLPTQVTLREGQSEQKTIDNGHNVSPSGYSQLGYIRGMNLSWAFGIDQREGRSSSKDIGIDVTQEVPPGFCLSYYRQAEQVRRYAKLVGHGVCGEVEDYGDAYIDDWQWSREVATVAGACPAPSTQLKPAGPCYQGCESVKVAPAGSAGVTAGAQN